LANALQFTLLRTVIPNPMRSLTGDPGAAAGFRLQIQRVAAAPVRRAAARRYQI